MDDQSSSGTVQTMLLNEAQQEIAALRNDLYNTRRVAEERRQAVEALTAARDKLNASVAELEATLKGSKQELARLHSVDEALSALQQSHLEQGQQLQNFQKSRKILEGELQEERRLRAGVEGAKAILESERSRLQKGRDELAAQLRLAQRQAQEAEEEQVAAEEESASLRVQLALLQTQQPASPPPQSTVNGATSSGFLPDGGARPLMEQVEYERNRASALLSALHGVKAELSELQQQRRQQEGTEQEVDRLRMEVLQLRSDLDAARGHIYTLEQQQLQQQQQLQPQQQQRLAPQNHQPHQLDASHALQHQTPSPPPHTHTHLPTRAL